MNVTAFVVLSVFMPAIVEAQGVGLAGGYGAGGAANALRELSPTSEIELLIFGDAGHDVFLEPIS